MIGEDTNRAEQPIGTSWTERPRLEDVRDSGARLVNLASDEAVTRFAQLEVIMCQWRRIESLLAETASFIYFATRTSLRKARLPR